MNGKNGKPSLSVVEVLKLDMVRMAIYVAPNAAYTCMYLGLVSLAVAVLL